MTDNFIERYNRILGTLYKLAHEGKTEGEREAARGRIAAIEKRMKANNIESTFKLDWDRLEKQRKEAERRAEEERKWQEELKRQAELKRKEEQKKKEEDKWKRRAKQKQKQEISKTLKSAMRANWINKLVSESIKFE